MEVKAPSEASPSKGKERLFPLSKSEGKEHSDNEEYSLIQ